MYIVSYRNGKRAVYFFNFANESDNWLRISVLRSNVIYSYLSYASVSTQPIWQIWQERMICLSFMKWNLLNIMINVEEPDIDPPFPVNKSKTYWIIKLVFKHIRHSESLTCILWRKNKWLKDNHCSKFGDYQINGS